ncbi:hypothetical protein ACFL6C_13035 [Myxococcota bacterium]
MVEVLTLTLDAPRQLPGATVTFTDVISHDGQEPVARFRAGLAGDRERQVELTPGGLFLAGSSLLEVGRFESRQRPAELIRHQIDVGPPLQTALSVEFDAPMGRWCELSTGNRIMLTGVGRFGAELTLTEKDGGTSFRWCDFGFWREDELLIRVVAYKGSTVRLAVDREADVNTVKATAYGTPTALGVTDVLGYPDGLQLRLRDAQRYCYGEVGWSFYAHHGDDVNYPYVSLKRRARADFRLLGRTHVLAARSMELTPPPSLVVSLEPQAMDELVLDEPCDLQATKALRGPEGLVIQYEGSGHAHGFSVGPDGEQVPVTEAWASFTVFKGGKTEGFRIDLTEGFETSTHDVFGYRIVVHEVSDQRARVVITLPRNRSA